MIVRLMNGIDSECDVVDAELGGQERRALSHGGPEKKCFPSGSKTHSFGYPGYGLVPRSLLSQTQPPRFQVANAHDDVGAVGGPCVGHTTHRIPLCGCPCIAIARTSTTRSIRADKQRKDAKRPIGLNSVTA
eukprot:1214121-Rhodomonas_salina.2